MITQAASTNFLFTNTPRVNTQDGTQMKHYMALHKPIGRAPFPMPSKSAYSGIKNTARKSAVMMSGKFDNDQEKIVTKTGTTCTGTFS